MTLFADVFSTLERNGSILEVRSQGQELERCSDGLCSGGLCSGGPCSDGLCSGGLCSDGLCGAESTGSAGNETAASCVSETNSESASSLGLSESVASAVSASGSVSSEFRVVRYDQESQGKIQTRDSGSGDGGICSPSLPNHRIRYPSHRAVGCRAESQTERVCRGTPILPFFRRGTSLGGARLRSRQHQRVSCRALRCFAEAAFPYVDTQRMS